MIDSFISLRIDYLFDASLHRKQQETMTKQEQRMRNNDSFTKTWKLRKSSEPEMLTAEPPLLHLQQSAPTFPLVRQSRCQCGEAC